MTKISAQLTMERETRISYASVPHNLGNDDLSEQSWQLKGDQFLLRAIGDHYFLYRRGKGVVIERGRNADPSSESLWLNGSVYAAVASINGLLPVHASAVALKGKVFAFTGSSGAGKSTLVAALGKRGLPMFCDDTLILDISDPQAIIALPGHKRLKLTTEAFHLTGAHREERVSAVLEKFYARPPGGETSDAAMLGALIVIEEGEELSLREIRGAERLTRLQDDHYTSQLFASASALDPQSRFAQLARLATAIPMFRFVRPKDLRVFEEGLLMVERFVRYEDKP